MSRRFRHVLAPMITMLMVVQSLMPGVWAENEAMVTYHDAVYAANMEVDGQPDSDANTDTVGQEALPDDPSLNDDASVIEEDTTSEEDSGEATEVADPDSEGVAPEEDAGAGTDAGDASTDGTESEEGLAVDADTGEGTSEALPEGQDVVAEDDDVVGPEEGSDDLVAPLSNSSRIAPMAIVGPGVTSVTVSPTTLADVCDPIRADGTWQVGADSTVGDTFTLEFDSRLNVAGGVRDIFAPGTTDLIAKMVVVGNVATFQMQVDGATGGTFFLESSSCWAQSVVGYTTTVDFTASSGATWNPTVELPRPGPNTNIAKSGTLSGDTITWSVSFPTGPSNGATIEDIERAGWEFIPGSFVPTNAGGSDLRVTEGANGITVTSGAYSSGTPSFTIQASLADGWEGLGLPTDDDGGTIFENIATGTNVGVNGVEVDLGPVDAQVVIPLPPGPNADITKSGSLSGDTITWSVSFPTGPSNGATIEDLERAGWEFIPGSFVPTNAGDSNLQVTEGADGITVTSGAYSSGTPSFTIQASLADGWEDLGLPTDEDGGTIFENIVTGTNTGLNGETTDLGPVDAEVVKPLPPGPGTDITKSGVLTGDETITWTIYFPAGPSAGATINDDAFTGWTFDYDSFTPNNVGGSDLQITGNSGSITVTSGSYDSGIPSFTIEATLVDGWEDLGLPTDDDGGTIFTNTITGRNEGLNGVGTDLGPVDGEATKPLPPGPNTDITKSGSLSGDTITWSVSFPTGPSNGATIEDLERTGWEFIPGSFVPTNAGDSNLQVTEGANGITVTSGAYTSGTPSFTIQATLVDGWEGLGLPTDDDGGTIFENIVTGTNTGLNGETTDLGPVDAEVVKPLPPGPNAEITKSGTLSGDTITWSVSFPTGPSNGATIEDLERAGWEFIPGSFVPTNAGGSDLQVTEGADGITVTSGAYTSGTPSFTIQATLVDGWEDLGLPTDEDGGTIFENIVTGTNTGLNGETTDLGPVDAEVVKPGPPATGTNPAKDGAWTTPGDQGALFPDGAIIWTVELPHGPAQSAVITDYAGEGWKFDCSTFQAGDFWTDGVQIEMTPTCTEDLLIVNVGAYGGNEWYVPSFTIEADITSVPSHQNGRGYNNTATSVVNNVDGTVTRNGTITSDWLVQQSNFGGDGRPYSIPVTPIVNDAVCESGVEPNPSIQLPANAFGLTYAVVDQIDPETGSYTVSATITDSHQWGFLGSGWSFDDEDPNVAIYTGTVDIVPCELVELVLPTVYAAVCEGGVEPNPSIVGVPTFAAGDDVQYTITQDINGEGNFVVAATIAPGVNKVWPATLPGNDIGTWTLIEGVMTFTGSVDIVPCEQVELILPTVEAFVCEGGVEPNPSIVGVPTFSEGDDVQYTITQQVDGDGNFIVTATIADGVNKVWPSTLPSNDFGTWAHAQDGSIVFNGNVTVIDCDPIVPVLPGIDGNVCEGGVPYPIQVTRPENTGEITYAGFTAVQLDPLNGVYIVTGTATIVVDGVVWDEASFEDGWTVTSATVASYRLSIPMDGCSEVVPLMPTLQGNVCEGGEYTEPTVRVPADTAVITYGEAQIEVVNGQIFVTVTAQIPDSGYMWSERQAPFYNGWEVLEDRTIAQFTMTYVENPCIPMTPQELPAIEGNFCEGGFYTSPTVSFTDVDGVATYTGVEVGEIENGTFRVIATATLDDGYEWNIDALPTGWEVDEENPANANYEGWFAEEPCAPVIPNLPTVTGNVCEGGFYTPPSVSFGENIEGVTLNDETIGGGVITATAMLDDGFMWNTDSADWPTGWTVDEENPARATYTGTYVEAPCAPVVPANPVVEQAVCLGGVIVQPGVTVTGTDRVSYEIVGDVVNGGTISIVATLTDGFEWDWESDLWPEGWIVNPEKLDEATLEVTLADIECILVSPAIIVVPSAVCEGGQVPMPGVELPTTPGVTYTKEGNEVPGGTVIITAIVEPGYKWGDLPAGWTADPNDPSRVTFEVSFEDPCTPVVPVAPVVTPAVCEDDKEVPPSVELPTTPGVTYIKSGEEVPGGTVTITATIEPGFKWGEMPEGWTLVDATTATFTVTFPAAVDCDPATEKPVEVTELPSTGTGTFDAGLSIMLASMAALMLAAVALRLNAFKRS